MQGDSRDAKTLHKFLHPSTSMTSTHVNHVYSRQSRPEKNSSRPEKKSSRPLDFSDKMGGMSFVLKKGPVRFQRKGKLQSSLRIKHDLLSHCSSSTLYRVSEKEARACRSGPCTFSLTYVPELLEQALVPFLRPI